MTPEAERSTAQFTTDRSLHDTQPSLPIQDFQIPQAAKMAREKPKRPGPLSKVKGAIPPTNTTRKKLIPKPPSAMITKPSASKPTSANTSATEEPALPILETTSSNNPPVAVKNADSPSMSVLPQKTLINTDNGSQADDVSSSKPKVQTVIEIEELPDNTLKVISENDYNSKICQALFNMGFQLVINTDRLGETLGSKGESERKKLIRYHNKHPNSFFVPTTKQKIPDAVLLWRGGGAHDVIVPTGYNHAKNNTIEQYGYRGEKLTRSSPAIRKTMELAQLVEPKAKKTKTKGGMTAAKGG
ncbi:hypothetical protein LTR05_008727 [Lithohypha guttulata]|uniref:Uncharacterized protein n=1 Tax=Lithohypha guttulata TaxID=1690604 RepID=A0AAN7Q773_9EURO|nr:hypothetical protein LTR05_008727 [Lithohypha guttulata]